MAKKLIPLLIAVAVLVLLTLAKTSEPSATSPQTTPATLPPVTTAAVNTPIASGSCTDTVQWDVAAIGSEVYAQGKYAEALSQVALTGNLRDDVINVALSQVGYHEGNSEKDYAGNNTRGSKDYTEFGRRLGSSGTAWCSEFASWCIRMAEVPQQAVSVSYSANAVNFTKNSSAAYYTWDVTAYCEGGYLPQKGDLLLWAWDKEAHSTEEDLSHTSILWEAKGNADGTVLLKTIDGNSNNQVRVRQYTVKAKDGTLTDRKGRLCYIISPDYE